MSLLADYHKEQGIKGVIESDSGFITYSIQGEECYIGDIYVIPEKRRSKLAVSLADQVAHIAKAKGCKILSGSVIPQANNPTRSIQMLISYGMKLLRAEPNIIWFVKEL